MGTSILTKRIGHRRLLTEIVCYAYVLVFMYAAVYKLIDLKFFQSQLKHSPLLGGYNILLSYLVPLSEIIASLFLLVPSLRKRGLVLATLIMLGFTIYIIYILGFSREIPCGCGGILATMGWKEHLVFNSAFVVAGITSIIFYRDHGRKPAG